MESEMLPSLESQKKEITQLMQTSISVENVWYVVADLSTYEKLRTIPVLLAKAVLIVTVKPV